MGKTLFRAIMLIGLGVVAGIVHAQFDAPMVTLPKQPAAAETKPSPVQPPAVVKAPTEKPETPVTPEKSPEQAPVPVPEQPVAVVPEATQPAPAATAPAQPAAADPDYMISVARAKELFDQQASGAWQGYFIDARRYTEFTEGHIRGAMHVDKKYFDGAIPAKVRDYLPGSSVVIYCHGEQCTDSEAVAKRLVALKLDIGPIYILKEGYPGWVQAGHPVDRGPEVGF